MSIFARGNWAVFGVEPDSLQAFQDSLNDELLRFKVSQLAAGVAIRMHGSTTAGINPFASPRLDETEDPEAPVDKVAVMDLIKLTEQDQPATVNFGTVLGLLPSEETLSIGNKAYAFWLVINDPKDVTDPASKKEALSYQHMGRPFKFLAKKEKEAIEEQVNSSAVMSRKQAPVIVDFQHARVYVESTSKEDILALRDILEVLGAKTFSLCWLFGEASWPSKFLNAINKDTRFSSEMRSRADELSKLRKDQVDKLEDKELEKVVSVFFAFTPLENGFVAGLGCPSMVRIHPVSDPVGVANPSVAFSLLEMTQDSEIAGANLTLMEKVVKKVKGGGEKTVNKPQLSVDINDNVNNFDAGAALLRGFDLPQFKRHVKVALKAQGSMEIKDFWAVWLTDLHDAVLTISDSIADALDLNDGGNYGLTVFEGEGDSVEIKVKGDEITVTVEEPATKKLQEEENIPDAEIVDEEGKEDDTSIINIS
jgi:hypothetical protein